MPTEAHAPAFEGLLFTFQQMRQTARLNAAPATGLAVAFSSANPGEGVSHTIHALLAEMGRDSNARTLLVDARGLRALTQQTTGLLPLCRALPGARDALYELVVPPGRSTAWGSSWEFRRDTITELRSLFDYVLVDCPSLKEANDLLSLAPFVDGIILVIEADKTRRDQILYAEKAVEFARGKLIGNILNKRSYVVPTWLYKRL